MSLKEIVQRMLHSFPIVLSGALLSIYIFVLFFGGGSDSYINMVEIRGIIISSAATNLTFFVFYSKKELSITQMRVRYIIHYLSVLTVMLFAANYMKWIKLEASVHIVIFASFVTVVYIIAITTGLYQTKTVADKLNQKLKERNKE